MKQLNKLKSLVFGHPPIYLINDGKPVDEKVIRLDDIYVGITIDTETGEPTGDFGWSRDPMMFHVPIREHYVAKKAKL